MCIFYQGFKDDILAPKNLPRPASYTGGKKFATHISPLLNCNLYSTGGGMGGQLMAEWMDVNKFKELLTPIFV